VASDLFLDTSFAIALAVSTDAHHLRALELATEIQSQSLRLVTTRAVLLEIGNALSRPRYRGAAAQLLASLEQDRQVEIVPLAENLYSRALAIFCSRSDKTWGLIDCVSFVVMTDRGISQALTADEHFLQAGFTPLLI
jgi:predicted nucleic acid-binding protein